MMWFKGICIIWKQGTKWAIPVVLEMILQRTDDDEHDEEAYVVNIIQKKLVKNWWWCIEVILLLNKEKWTGILTSCIHIDASGGVACDYCLAKKYEEIVEKKRPVAIALYFVLV